LPITDQQEISLNGHALEFRLYAEDPVTFMPSPGTLSTLQLSEVEGVRIDNGYAEGEQVTPFYDPLIAKIIVHASTREAAMEKAKVYITYIRVEGVEVIDPLVLRVLEESSFIDGH